MLEKIKLNTLETRLLIGILTCLANSIVQSESVAACGVLIILGSFLIELASLVVTKD
jgi:hypothetical protein